MPEPVDRDALWAELQRLYPDPAETLRKKMRESFPVLRDACALQLVKDAQKRQDTK